jgi:hypothetical protein
MKVTQELNKLNNIKSKENYHTEVSNKFAALGNLVVDVEINSARETIRENTKIVSKESLGYYELRKHKLWFDKKMIKIIRTKETS